AERMVRAGELFRQCGSDGSEAMILLNLGEIYYHLGRLDAADGHLAGALDIVRERGHRRAEADTLRVLAAVRRERGDHRRALELAGAALGSAHDTGGDQWVRTDALNTYGSIEQVLGRHRSARDSHERALALARRTGASYQQVEALTLLATAHHGLGEADHARRCVDEALAISRPAGFRLLEGRALAALAAVELDEGKPERAADLVRQAVAIQRDTGHRLGEARALLLLGQALRHSDPGAAKAHWRQAYDLFVDVGTPDADDVLSRLGQLRTSAAFGGEGRPPAR
ncbi:MAG TPA: tetratricopeptide repeat protein, partial [Pilimelia sp.]|nr:tetratricopeptide repeat protein [Pilimelia sp.]